MTGRLRLCIVALIITAVVSFNLLLYKSPLKFFFLTFELLLIVFLLYHFSYSKTFDAGRIGTAITIYRIDITFFILTLALLVCTLLNIINVITLVLTISTTFFSLGYAVLRLLAFKPLKTPIEWGVLSFFTSIPITCLFYNACSLLPLGVRSIGLSIAFLVFSSLPIVKRMFQAEGEREARVTQRKWSSNLLLLIPTLLFFLIAIMLTYPTMANVPGLDIVLHYTTSMALNENPYTFSSLYPWFHIQQAAVILLSNAPRELFLTALALLNIFTILAFYIMAKAYLSNLSEKLPALATLLWTLFSGFGWLYVLRLGLTNPNISYIALLNSAHNESYWDIGYAQGPWIWLWFRPYALGIIGLLTLLYLLKRTDLDNKSLLVLTGLMSTTMVMLHLSELIIYLILLLALSVFISTSTNTTLDSSLKGSMFALLTTIGIWFIYSIVGIQIRISLLHIVLLFALTILSLLLYKLRIKLSGRTFRSITISTKQLFFLLTGLSIVWLGLLTFWLVREGGFLPSTYAGILAVPWMFYPVLLGVCGLLAFPGIYYTIKERWHTSLTPFLVLLVTSLAFGKILTYINVLFGSLGFWERRIIPFTFLALTVFASVAILLATMKIRPNLLLTSFLLSIIVFGGITSTTLTVEHQAIAIQKTSLTPDELHHVNMLNGFDSNSYCLTLSPRSLSITQFAPFAWRIGSFRNQLWPATSPELVLNTLHSTAHPSVIYLREDDYLNHFTQEYLAGYLSRHFLPNTLPFYTGSDGTIFYTEPKAAPVENSDVVFVVEKWTPTYLYTYNILSLAGYNYTTAHITDIQTLAQAKVVITPSEITAQKILSLKNDVQLEFENLIILNLEGYYGELAQIANPSISICLTSSYFGQVHLHDLINPQEELMNTTGIQSIPFILEAEALNNSLVLADEGSAASWETSAFLEGTIGLPQLTDDPVQKISGNDSLKIDVPSGSYAQWQISWNLPVATNLEHYDFLSFYWQGRGDGNKYIVSALAPIRPFWYEFTDDREGWRKIVLPMHITNGSYSILGTYFDFVQHKGANWNETTGVDIRLSGKNLNVGGTFRMDRFSFEKSTNVTLTIPIHGNLQKLQLDNFYLNNDVPLVELSTSGTVSIPEYHMTDGTSTEKLLGEFVGNLTLTQHNQTYSEALLEIKIPTISNQSSIETAFNIVPTYKMNSASAIQNETDTIVFPVGVAVTPLNSSSDKVAYYNDENRTFFASEMIRNETKITYINFFPLITQIEEGAKNLYSSLGNLIQLVLGGLSSYTFGIAPVNAGNTAAFRYANLEGNTTMGFESILIHSSTKGKLVVTVDGGPSYSFGNNETICPVNFRAATLRTEYLEISPGDGYYIEAYIRNATLILEGEQMNLVSFTSEVYNSTLTGDTMTVVIENTTFLLRRPLFSTIGQGAFTDLYTYHELYSTTLALGDDCLVTGSFEFTGDYGDTYTVTNDFRLTGFTNTSEGYLEFDDLSVFLGSIPFMAMWLDSFLIFYVVVFLRKRPR